MHPRKSRAQPLRTAQSQAPTERPYTATLPLSDPNPPQLFILPESATSTARFVSLANPATSQLNRYLYCPKTGFYEFKQFGQPKSVPTSFLLAREDGTDASCTSGAQAGNTQNEESRDGDNEGSNKNYILDSSYILLATPIDPMFFLTPLITPGIINNKTGRPHLARLAEDHLETLGHSSRHMAQLLKRRNVRVLLEKRMEEVSQMDDVGGETLYRFNALLLLDLLVEKAKRATRGGVWPQSLERHVMQQLETPATKAALRNAESRESAQSSKDGASEEVASNANESQEPIEPPSQRNTTASKEVIQKLRIRTALEFLLSSYIAPELRKYLQRVISSNSRCDFKDLDVHLNQIEKLKEEARVLRSLSDTITHKRKGLEDDEARESRAEKKRKKEEEDKRTKAESRATKELKKVDTSGMKKLSSFFTKKPVS